MNQNPHSKRTIEDKRQAILKALRTAGYGVFVRLVELPGRPPAVLRYVAPTAKGGAT